MKSHMANFFGCIDRTLTFPTTGISAELSIIIFYPLNTLFEQSAGR
jgi:hypothetical protein